MAYLMTTKCLRPVSAEQAQIITPSTTMLDSCYQVLYIITKNLHFGLVSSKDIVLEVLWFVQMQLYKLRPFCHFLFRKKMLSQPFQTSYTC